MLSRLTILVTIWWFGIVLPPADAQSLTPMRQDVASFADQFVFQLVARNPTPRPTEITFVAYDLAWEPLEEVQFSQDSMQVGAGGRARVLAFAPFNGERERELRICAQMNHAGRAGAMIRGQVCGRYRAVRAGD